MVHLDQPLPLQLQYHEEFHKDLLFEAHLVFFTKVRLLPGGFGVILILVLERKGRDPKLGGVVAVGDVRSHVLRFH